MVLKGGEGRGCRSSWGEIGKQSKQGFLIVLCIVGSSNLFIYTSFLCVIFGLINQCFLHNISLSRCVFDIGIYTINFVLFHRSWGEMGALFRSEEMALCQLFIQPEAAYASIATMGEAGIVQFRDVSTRQIYLVKVKALPMCILV